ncbi:MAG TPA: hypothetical protein VJ843_05270, partial [Candidatus Saccharimonadales bacterium]|nr:hypothetical protein [Candidatus Saccharimonadales bacterium]
MGIPEKLKQPAFLISVLAISILSGFALFSPSHSQSTHQPDAAKSVAKLFKLKPSKKQTTATKVTAQALLSPNPSQTTTLPVIHKSGTLTADETWTAGNVYMVDYKVVVPDGVMLTIDAGTIVKFTGYYGIEVQEGGALNVTGSSSDPAVFTSYRDDSVGGDSNNDGASNGATQDYTYAVSGYKASINVAGAIFKDATYSLSVACDSNTTSTVSVTDSLLQSTFAVSSCGQGLVSLERNELAAAIGYAINAYDTDMSGIILTGSNENLATGIDQGRAISAYYSRVSSGATWRVSSSSHAVLVVGSLTVNGTLTLDPGVIVKSGGNVILSVASGGTLNANGTSAN